MYSSVAKNVLPDKHCKHLALRAPNWIGDLIMAQPAMKSAMDSLKPAITSIIGPPWIKDLIPLLNLGPAEACTAFPDSADVSIVFPNSFRSAWQSFRSGSPVRIGYRDQWRRFLLKPGLQRRLSLRHQHHREHYLDICHQMGFPVLEEQVHLAVNEETRKKGGELLASRGLNPQKVVCIIPGAKFGSAKRYPAPSYRKVIQVLAEKQQMQAIALGTGDEEEVAANCLKDLPTASWNAAGSTSLSEAIQILSAVQLVICNDSGLMHVAAGIGQRVIALFGATDPARTAPSGARTRIIFEPAGCSPCLKRECHVSGQPCMQNISPEKVVNIAIDMMMAQ